MIINLCQVKMMVVLGELGGRDEYSLVEALKQGKVNKPVVAWVSGTCARLFKSEVQFGHAVSDYVAPDLSKFCKFSRINLSYFFCFISGGKEWWGDGVGASKESSTKGCWCSCSDII